MDQTERGAFVWRGEQKKVRRFCVERETKEGAAGLRGGKQKKVRQFGGDGGKDAPHPFVRTAREKKRTGAFLRTIL